MSIFSCAYLLLVFFFGEMLNLLPNFTNLCCLFSYYWILQLLYIFWIKVIYQICVLKIFCGLCFHSLTSFIWAAEILNLMKSSWSVFSFMVCTFNIVSKNSLLNPRSCRFSSIFLIEIFCRSFRFYTKIHDLFGLICFNIVWSMDCIVHAWGYFVIFCIESVEH